MNRGVGDMEEVKYMTDVEFNDFLEQTKDLLFKASEFYQLMELFDKKIDSINEQSLMINEEQAESYNPIASELINILEKIEQKLQ